MRLNHTDSVLVLSGVDKVMQIEELLIVNRGNFGVGVM